MIQMCYEFNKERNISGKTIRFLPLKPPPKQLATGVPADLLGNRPDLIAAHFRLAGIDHEIAEARVAIGGANVGRGGPRRINTDDQRIVQRLVWQVRGQLVVKDAVCGDKPLRQRPVDKQQQHADEAQRDNSVTLLFLLRFQR